MNKQNLLFNDFIDALQTFISIALPFALTFRSFAIEGTPSSDARLALAISAICLIIYYSSKFKSIGKFQKFELAFGILSLLLTSFVALSNLNSNTFNKYDLISVISFGIGVIPIFLEMMFALFLVDTSNTIKENHPPNDDNVNTKANKKLTPSDV